MSLSWYDMVLSSFSFRTHVFEATHWMCSVFREQRRRAARSYVHVFFILSLSLSLSHTHTHTHREAMHRERLAASACWCMVSSVGVKNWCFTLLWLTACKRAREPHKPGVLWKTLTLTMHSQLETDTYWYWYWYVFLFIVMSILLCTCTINCAFSFSYVVTVRLDLPSSNTQMF